VCVCTRVYIIYAVAAHQPQPDKTHGGVKEGFRFRRIDKLRARRATDGGARSRRLQWRAWVRAGATKRGSYDLSIAARPRATPLH